MSEMMLDKINTLKMSPATLGAICDHVANGGSLRDRCKLWDVPFNVMVSWINDVPERREQYNQAVMIQMSWAIDRILDELKDLGTVDIVDAYQANGQLKQIGDIPENIRRSIASIETLEEFEGVGRDREVIGHVKKIKLYDKTKALELLGRKFAMFIDRSRLEVSNKTIEDLINESMSDPKSIPGDPGSSQPANPIDVKAVNITKSPPPQLEI